MDTKITKMQMQLFDTLLENYQTERFTEEGIFAYALEMTKGDHLKAAREVVGMELYFKEELQDLGYESDIFTVLPQNIDMYIMSFADVHEKISNIPNAYMIV